MKPFHAMLLAGVLLTAGSAHGQGLLSLGQNADFPESVPLTFNVTVGGGYDRTEYDIDSGLEDADLANVDSYYITGGVGLTYGNNDRVTRWNVGADFGVLHYLDDPQYEKDLYYNARVAFNIAHEFSRRLSVVNNLYFTYEIEPDYAVGVSTSRRSGQYVYGYNNLAVAYAWSERVATTTGYTISGIRYVDDEIVGEFNDRLEHLFSQQISYELTRTTKLVGEYRYGITDYTNEPEAVDGTVGNPDYTSHYLLAGVDQAWSERTSVSFRAGAQIYESDRSDETAPYAEASLTYALSRQTSLRIYGVAGFDGSELGLYDSRYSYRTGATLTHAFTDRFTGSMGVHYIHSNYEGNDTVETSNEDEINASVGFSYNFWSNLSLDAGYSFTTVNSDAEFSDYDRHLVNLGFSATF